MLYLGSLCKFYDDFFFNCSEALEIDPNNKSTNAKLYFNRATVAAKQKKTDQSIADCTRALDLDPCYIKALLR
jgi:DnaJ family protein C protein 7